MSFWPRVVIISLLGALIKDVEAGCPRDAIRDEESGMCYMKAGVLMGWSDARAFCFMQWKADLLGYADSRTLAMVKPLVSGAVFWVGLNDRNKEGKYSWLNNPEPASGVLWSGDGLPVENDQQDCAVADGTNIKTQLLECDTFKQFVCAYADNGESRDQPEVTCGNPLRYGYGWGPKKCFATFNEPKTWEDAKEACESIHPQSSMVNVHDFQFQDELIRFMRVGQTYWTGFNDRQEEGVFKWLDSPEPTPYLSWTQGRPSTESDNEQDCVSMSRDVNNIMKDELCSKTLPYICEMPPGLTPITTTRPPITGEGYECDSADWALHEAGRTCFKLVTRPRVWSNAKEDCQNQGGVLAAIRDSDTHEFIKTNVMGTGRSWIGLRLEDDGKFKWLGDSEGTQYKAFRNRPTNPNGNEYCVEIIGKHEGLWNDKVCNAKRGYICQKDALRAEIAGVDEDSEQVIPVPEEDVEVGEVFEEEGMFIG